MRAATLLLGAGAVLLTPPGAFAQTSPDTGEAASWSPTRIAADAPVYPRQAMMMGIEARCDVEFRIDQLGEVRVPELVCESPELFMAAAREAVESWRFEPYPGPEALSPVLRQPIRFELN